jgi:hypothetical protein
LICLMVCHSKGNVMKELELQKYSVAKKDRHKYIAPNNPKQS